MGIKITLKPDKEYVQKMRNALQENNNFCPCQIRKNDMSTKCMCEDFKEMIDNKKKGECHCNLYYISEE